MSDDYPAYFNAWIKIMTLKVPPKKLLCPWHVNKNWHEALSKIESKKGEVKIKQVEVYQMLCFLLEETEETVFDETVFNESLAQALNTSNNRIGTVMIYVIFFVQSVTFFIVEFCSIIATQVTIINMLPVQYILFE